MMKKKAIKYLLDGDKKRKISINMMTRKTLNLNDFTNFASTFDIEPL